EYLAARGFAVCAPKLAGHVGTTADLARTGWPDWYQSVEEALARVAARAQRLYVCGLSLGGLLTLELARRHPEVRAIAVLATALWLTRPAVVLDRALIHVPILQRAWLPKMAGSDILDVEMKRANGIAHGGAGMPLSSLHSLIEFGQRTRTHLSEVTQPALVA